MMINSDLRLLLDSKKSVKSIFGKVRLLQNSTQLYGLYRLYGLSTRDELPLHMLLLLLP
jgi:hypothetical protein